MQLGRLPMKTIGSLLLAGLFCLLPVSAQQTSPNTPTPNPQDVPQQQPPGTNSPDVMKQRRPAPDSSQGNTGDQRAKDVPKQEPGTNNPDVGKQRHDDKADPTGSSPTAGQGDSKKKTKGQKRSSGTSSTACFPSSLRFLLTSHRPRSSKQVDL